MDCWGACSYLWFKSSEPKSNAVFRSIRLCGIKTWLFRTVPGRPGRVL